MAVAFDGFSIRGYTAKMRTADEAKCWPFQSEAAGNDHVPPRKLPPIGVAKFRWWAHELTRLRRAESESSAAGEFVAAAPGAAAAVCPVCRDFSAPTVDDVNAHIDACLAAADRAASEADRQALAAILMRRSEVAVRSARAKPRPTKKRSIAEIFAVAPQIDPIDHSDEEGREKADEIQEEDNDGVSAADFRTPTLSKRGTTGSTAKKKKKKRKITINKGSKRRKMKRVLEENKNLTVALNNNNEKTKKKKKKKKKKKIKGVDGRSITTIKNNAQKFKLQNHVSFAKRLKKRFAMDFMNSDSGGGKKTVGKYLFIQDKQNVHEAPFRLTERNQEPSPPIRSILKNHSTNCEPKSAIHSLQSCSEANPCGIQISERHVRFSEKDDILGPKKNDTRFPEKNVETLCSIGTTTSPESSRVANTETISVEINTSEDDTSIATDYGAQVQPVIREEQSTDIPRVELPSSPRLPIPVQDYTRVLQERSTVSPTQSSFYENNLHMPNESYQTAVLKSAFTGIPRIFQTISRNGQVGGTVTRPSNCNGRLINHVQDPYQRACEINPMENTCRLPEPSSCYIANQNENHRLRFQARPAEEIAIDPSLHHQPLCRSHPMDFIGGLCSFQPEWKQQAVVFRERSTDADFFGLPLNSQGELIQASSRGKSMFIDPRETNMIGPSSGFFPAHNLMQPSPRSTADYLGVNNKHFVEREFPNDRVNLFLSQNYPRENHRVGVSYWESTGRADIHDIDFERRTKCSYRPLNADLNLMSFSFDGCRPYGPVESQKMNETINPRESSGKTPLSTRQPTMRLMGKDVPIGKSSNEMKGLEDGKVWTDKEIVVDHCQSVSGLNSPMSAINFQEWVPQIPSGKHKETVPQCLEIRSDKSAHNPLQLRTPGSGFSRPYLNCQENNLFQCNSFASSRNPSPNLFPVAHVPASSTVFDGAPHLRDFFVSGGEPVRLSSQLPVPSTPRDTCEHLDWRPAELTHRQNPPHFSEPSFDFPFLNPGSRANHVPSPWFQNSDSLPSWLLQAKQQGKTPSVASQPIAIATSKQPQHISSRTNILNTPLVYHAAEEASYSCNPQPNTSLGSASIALPPLVPTTGFRNRMKVKERLKSKALGIKDLYPCKKTNKKIVDKSSLDLARVPSLEMCEMPSPMTRYTTENLKGEIRRDMVTDDGYCYTVESRHSEMRSSSNESLRVDGMGRSGPIKLSAGAKHILKPNQNLDIVENFVPIHSTIPFSGLPNCVTRVPNESQKKATKIYRF